MQFEADALYDWLSAWEDRAKHVLASSGMASTSTGDLGIDPKLFEGSLGYGALPVEPALHRKVAHTYGFGEDQTLITLAGSEADLLGIWSNVKPGDKVVVENPTYPPLQAIPKALGCKVELHQRTFADRFRLDLAKLDTQLKGAKLLCVTNVNNPTGVSISKRELEELHTIAARRRCTVLVDEAFRELSFLPLPVAASLGERFVSTGTLTKMYGLGGLRTGWLLGDKKLVARALTAKKHTSIGQPVLEQRAALVALEQRMDLLARGRRIRDANFAVLHHWLGTHPKLRWVEPDGAPVCFPLLPKGTDDLKFGTRLVEERSTLVVPGRYHGLKQHFRLGWGMQPGGLEPGLREIDGLLGA
ncbi:MAG: aminotransferase class I/II-fold pyridoxal phosphate-dependent enzyme [Halobacteriales archaeon]|nr:aminotransferase class I/II-fold pyridoxal phosphate-dependent enzyme [Halobacteriales archaeon]